MRGAIAAPRRRGVAFRIVSSPGCRRLRSSQLAHSDRRDAQGPRACSIRWNVERPYDAPPASEERSIGLFIVNPLDTRSRASRLSERRGDKRLGASRPAGAETRNATPLRLGPATLFLRSLRSFAVISLFLSASGSWIEQIETRFRIFFLDQLNRLIRQKQFECRPDRGRNDMPATRSPIRKSNYRMSMNSRLPINQSDVSAERGHLDLVRERNLPKRILLAIKPSQQSVLM